MRYYSTQRPVSPGSYPTGAVISIVNFDTKQYIHEIDGNAWGYIEYGIELPVEDANAYELVPSPPYHCTNKQTAALRRIVSRGQKKYNTMPRLGGKFDVCGQRFSDNGYAITDGAVMAFVPGFLNGLPYDSSKPDADLLYRILTEELNNGDYYSVDLDDVRYDTPDLSYIREQIANRKKEGKENKTFGFNPRCEVMFKANCSDGSEIIGVYDAELIRDAVECVGKHPICYIGYNKNKQRPYPFFLVGSDDSLWNISSGIHAIVMPLAKHSI